MVAPVGKDFKARLGAPDADMIVIYDGQCPFCTSYVKLVRLREAVGRVALIDVRSEGIAATVDRELGLDLNDGMLAVYAGRAYYGAEAMNLLSTLTSRSGLLNCAIAAAFRSEPAARALYPFMRAGRGAALRLLGRGRIAVPQGADR